MLFTQIEFLLLFAAVFAIVWSLRGNHARKLVLLAASYYFYAYWDWRFLGLILASTVIDYAIGRALARITAPRWRKTLLVASIVSNLGLLGVFKYFGFFVGSMAAVLSPLGVHVGTLEIILPVGISFYTFQTLSYTIDVFRRRCDACPDFFDFALFVAFFPQLVAGPIVRAVHLLPQLASRRELTWQRTWGGFSQFTVGLFKKAFIADRIAVFVDEVFANAGAYDASTTWLAVVAYAVQIYCDFSGYSDMAIGAARALGYDFARNFDYPYLARSITDFWRRWHISLSSWLRDYLYIPLGGSRRGAVRTSINLMLTMLLGGLWHGAAWTFVFWGGLHGAALVAEKWIGPRPRGEASPLGRALNGVIGWAVTMLVVLVAWVFFRSRSFDQALLMLRQMFLRSDGVEWHHPFVIFAIALVAASHWLQTTRHAAWRELPASRMASSTILFTMWWAIIVFPARGFAPFIYFQF